MTALLDVQGISRSFGKVQAVDGLSFQVRGGEVWGFIGPNGAGKTTTMRICATLDLPDRGDVLLDGHSVLIESDRVRERIGFMPDVLGKYANVTVWEYLDFYARCVGLRGAERTARLDEVMGFTELHGLGDRPMDGLSKGMSQRLCLAKTLLHDPQLLILDEPASGLDPRARVEFRELVRALADQGKGVLISSHILSELTEICDGVVVIEQGALVRAGRVQDLAGEMSREQIVFVRCLEGGDPLRRALAEQAGVASSRRERSGVVFEFDGDEKGLAALLKRLIDDGFQVTDFRSKEINLEEMFLSFTEGRLQ